MDKGVVSHNFTGQYDISDFCLIQDSGSTIFELVLESTNLRSVVTYQEESAPAILSLVGEIGGLIYILHFLFSLPGNYFARKSITGKIASQLYFQKNDKKSTKIHDSGNLLGVVLQPYQPGWLTSLNSVRTRYAKDTEIGNVLHKINGSNDIIKNTLLVGVKDSKQLIKYSKRWVINEDYDSD